MSMRPPLLASGIVLDAPDAAALAEFYRALLGWEVEHEDDGWVKLRSPHGGAGLAFQTDSAFVPPVWPGCAGEQRTTCACCSIRRDTRSACGIRRS
jgi:catechol 2,3-dioxygenase-like lactoylglutathione lyase family enzyme